MPCPQAHDSVSTTICNYNGKIIQTDFLYEQFQIWLFPFSTDSRNWCFCPSMSLPSSNEFTSVNFKYDYFHQFVIASSVYNLLKATFHHLIQNVSSHQEDLYKIIAKWVKTENLAGTIRKHFKLNCKIFKWLFPPLRVMHVQGPPLYAWF